MDIKYSFEEFERDTEFPIIVTRRHRTKSEVIMTYLHFHDSLEVSMTTYGKGYYEFEDKKILLETGDCVVINNLEPHRSLSAGVDWEQICIMFTPILVWKGTSELDYSYISNFFYNGNGFKNLVKKDDVNLEVQSLVTEIHKEFQNKEEGYKMMVKAKLLCLLTHLYRHYRKHYNNIHPLKLNMRKLSPALKYIEQNYLGNISLADAANACSYSPQYFSKMFSQSLGMSFIKYVTKLRINQSKRLLETTNLTILDIATRCGYNNLSNFLSMFKNETNFSPLQYRKNVSSKPTNIK